MPDAYYRIAANKSEADSSLYQHARLTKSLSAVASQRKDNVPTFKDIRLTHRFPLKQDYKPIVLLSNDIVEHTTNTGKFVTEYKGDTQGQMYMKTHITAGEVDAVLTQYYTFQYCENFVPALINKINFKVNADHVCSIPGAALFVYSRVYVTPNMRPGLMRLWKETVVTLKYGVGMPLNPAAQAAYTVAITSFTASMPHTPLNAPAYAKPAFDLYIPLDIITTAKGVDNPFPTAALHNLERTVEFEYNTLTDYINVIGADDGGTTWDYVNPSNATWLSTPSISSTLLYVNYILVHRDLQKIMALNGAAYVIRQFEADEVIVTNADRRELSYTKVIDSIAIIARYFRNTTRVETGATITINLVAINTEYPIDPFFLPMDTNPISTINVTARGQVFYQNKTWDELSAVFPYIFGSDQSSAPLDRSLAMVTFNQKLTDRDLFSTYNSGYGPNVTIQWGATAFSTTDATKGAIIFIVIAVNVIAAYRGVMSIRYI
jgi:hypothetical protein